MVFRHLVPSSCLFAVAFRGLVPSSCLFAMAFRGLVPRPRLFVPATGVLWLALLAFSTVLLLWEGCSSGATGEVALVTLLLIVL